MIYMKLRVTQLPIFGLLYCLVPLFGQGPCLIKVMDSEGDPLQFATVVFPNDTIQKGGYTDSLGIFELAECKSRMYTINLSYVGYMGQTAVIKFEENKKFVALTMIKDSVLLDEVSVTAFRKVIKRMDDRLIMQIDGLKTYGNQAIEILEKAPGIDIRNDPIQFLGKGVQIQLNGSFFCVCYMCGVSCRV